MSSMPYGRHCSLGQTPDRQDIGLSQLPQDVHDQSRRPPGGSFQGEKRELGRRRSPGRAATNCTVKTTAAGAWTGRIGTAGYDDVLVPLDREKLGSQCRTGVAERTRTAGQIICSGVAGRGRSHDEAADRPRSRSSVVRLVQKESAPARLQPAVGRARREDRRRHHVKATSPHRAQGAF